MCIASCPIVWSSKLIGDISMSTMEAEYSALSMAMKTVLPLRRVIKQLSIDIGLVSENLTTFKTRVHEDNNGCLMLSKLEPGRMTLRSKHYAVNYHWFRSHIKPNAIEIIKIDTKMQKVDIFTKGLNTHLLTMMDILRMIMENGQCVSWQKGGAPKENGKEG